MDNKLGKVISELRKEKGLTQKDLARELCISDKAVSRWECGTSRPTLEMMYQISKYFKVSYNDLITARISDNSEDDKIVEAIIKEFSDLGSKRIRRIKMFLLFSIAIILILTIAIIFTNSYNRFKVYNVGGEIFNKNDNPNNIYGTYIDTNIKDILYIYDIKINGVNLDSYDNVSVDLIIKNDKEEVVIQSRTLFEDLCFEISERNIDSKSLKPYFDNLYLRISYKDNNKAKRYEFKLEFTIDFSNNKIYHTNEFYLETYNYEVTDYSKINIEEILIDNGYEKILETQLYKSMKDYNVNYFSDSNKIIYVSEVENLKYEYKYNLNSHILEVEIKNKNLTTIEKYQYEIINNKMNCEIGSCNDANEILKLLDEKVLYLFE